MKRALVLVATLMLSAGLAWAETPAVPAPAGGDSPAAVEGHAADPAVEGGGCLLPDLAGLSQDEASAVALGAGFQTASTAAAVPACPTSFRCSSLTNCAKGSPCSITDIGTCCSQSGLVLCCTSGTIKVRECPCRCTAFHCLYQCVLSNDVQWSCS